MANVTNPVSVLYQDSSTGQPVPVSDSAPMPVTGGASPLAVQTSYPFSNISTADTTVVKSGAGVLHSVIVNTKGTVASTVTIYDNTAASGTKIGTIDSLNLSGTFIFDAEFGTGLTVVTTGTVAPNITVMYR